LRAAGRVAAIAAVTMFGLIGLLGLLGAEVASAATAGTRVMAATGAGAASLAAANIGKSAGSCAVQPSVNSLGGSAFDGSCTGANGKPEYWCADFAMWVWQNTGFYSGGLTAGAGSFYVYGQANGTLHTSVSYVPQPGDAVVYDYNGKNYADHVAIVTALNSDGSVVTVNGDWNGGTSTSESVFATLSSVVSVTIPASQRMVGTIPSTVDPGDHYQISAYITPATGPGSGISPPHAPAINPYSAAALCGTGYGVIDSHDLGNAMIYLLYNGANGDNCVTTLADSPGNAVPISATLSVQGGPTGGDSGNYVNYAGPVTEYAPGSCVKWGGSYQATSWTSAWSHCG